VTNRTSPDPHDENQGPGSGLQIFDNGEFQLRLTPVGDSFIVEAPGLARALGMRDAYRLVDTLPDDEKTYTTTCTSGDQGIWHLTEPGMYRAIGRRQTERIKNEGIKDQVERFQRWFYHDVLPSIRKTGSYSMPTAQPVIPSHAETLRRWAAELEAREAAEMRAAIERAGREAAEEENAILGPKAAEADHHRAADGCMAIGDFANKLKAWALQNCGVRILHEEVWDFLGEIGLLIRGNTIRKNEPTSFATERDFVRTKTTRYPTKTRGEQVSTSPRLTTPGAGWAWDRAVIRLNDYGTLRKPMGGAA
jgi:anti-repressor protein